MVCGCILQQSQNCSYQERLYLKFKQLTYPHQHEQLKWNMIFCGHHFSVNRIALQIKYIIDFKICLLLDI